MGFRRTGIRAWVVHWATPWHHAMGQGYTTPILTLSCRRVHGRILPMCGEVPPLRMGKRGSAGPGTAEECREGEAHPRRRAANLAGLPSPELGGG